MKNSDSDKKYENLSSRKRELEEEKLTIQKQMEKKDSEINDLNTRLNEKIAELQSMNSDKKVADEQLVSLSKILCSLSSRLSLNRKNIKHLMKQLHRKIQSLKI